MLGAMAASTGGPGTLTRSSVAAASVMLCAMVSAVTVSATRRQSRTRIHWEVASVSGRSLRTLNFVTADRRVDRPGARSRSRRGVSEGDPEADADQPDYGPEVELVSVEEAHHKSHDHNCDRGNSNPLPFLALV